MLRTLSLTTLSEGSPPQKRLRMARIVKGSHSFTCHRHIYTQRELTLPDFRLTAKAGPNFSTPGGMEG